MKHHHKKNISKKRLEHKKKHKIGVPPGTLIYTGDQSTGNVKISIIEYDEKNFVEREISNIEECIAYIHSPTITWIKIVGIHQVDVVEKIGKTFNIHPLTLEDIVNTQQRPKFEDFNEYLVAIVRMIYYDQEITSEQLSIILARNVVISFQEKDGDLFESIRERLRQGKGRIRKCGADYLMYALIDTIVDNYFLILEKLSDNIEKLEEHLINEPTIECLHELHNLKSEMLHLRKTVWPMRDLISSLQRSETKLIHENTDIYLRDVYDHTVRVIDTVETYRDILAGMLDIYLSSNSNKMNEVMKVLTMISTIFIPVTFIVGVYGMNFDHMPELRNEWSYPAVWIIMVSIMISLLFYFKRKKWL